MSRLSKNDEPAKPGCGAAAKTSHTEIIFKPGLRPEQKIDSSAKLGDYIR
jgi:hypothetical protein